MVGVRFVLSPGPPQERLEEAQGGFKVPFLLIGSYAPARYVFYITGSPLAISVLARCASEAQTVRKLREAQSLSKLSQHTSKQSKMAKTPSKKSAKAPKKAADSKKKKKRTETYST